MIKNTENPYSFVSYSHNDQNLVYSILNQLEEKNYRLWYDTKILSGTEWADSIARHLKHENCVKFIIFISKNSIDSENVKDEVHIAKKYNKKSLVVFLEEVELPDGLELYLDRSQRLDWYKESEKNRLNKLIQGIPTETMRLPKYEEETENELTKRYTLLSTIGRGGSGVVYKATMNSTGATVIIKMSDNDSVPIKRLFENERDRLSMLQCPFIPNIIDYGTCTLEGRSRIYIVESFISGKTLLSNDSIESEKSIVDIVRKVANILKYLYSLNVVHGDIKPQNIMIDSFGQVYLLDFGSSVEANSMPLCMTPGFSSPEQIAGEKIDVRMDLYSLGATMRYLLTKPALKSKRIKFQDSYKYRIKDLMPSINPLLEMVTEKMIDARKEYRFQTIDELLSVLKTLESILSEDPLYNGFVSPFEDSWAHRPDFEDDENTLSVYETFIRGVTQYYTQTIFDLNVTELID